MIKILDACCCAGGAAKGYKLAMESAQITGIDTEPQPNYPYTFVQDDAIAYIKKHGKKFDFIHASPPCQAHSNMTHRGRGQAAHISLIDEIRTAILQTKRPYIIENVVGAPLQNPIMLCGSSFALRVRRHRLFESNMPLYGKPCDHAWQDESKIYKMYQHYAWHKTGVVPVYGSGGSKASEHWNEAMGIDWMSRKEIVEAIPPAYTQFLGLQVANHLRLL